MAEVNVSDIVRHIIMSTEYDNSNDEELRKLTFFLEQQEQKGIQNAHLTTIIRVIPIRTTTYTKVNFGLGLAEDKLGISKGYEWSENENRLSAPDVFIKPGAILTSITNRAGPIC